MKDFNVNIVIEYFVIIKVRKNIDCFYMENMRI